MGLPLYNGDRRAGRRCGPCTACCTALSVHEIGKGEFVRCKHLRAGRGGCQIYAERPSPCREWACAWMMGFGPASARPDKTGVIVDIAHSDPLGMYMIKLYETRAGAIDSPIVVGLIEAMLAHGPDAVVVAIRSGNRRSIIGGSPAGLARAREILEAAQLDPNFQEVS